MKYLEERENISYIEEEHGFATYKIIGQDVYLQDIWVEKDFRQTKLASEMADKIVKIAKQKQCKRLIGSVVPSANNSTTSLKVLLGYGFKLFKSQDNFILFEKLIEE